MHLRVTEEAEMNGLDIDQFFDEQIGDWGMFDELTRRKGLQGISEIDAPGTPPSQVVPVDGSEKKD